VYSPGEERRRWPGRFLVWIVLMAAVLLLVVVLLLGGILGSSPAHPLFGVWGGFFLLFLVLWIGFFTVRMVFWSRAIRYRRGQPGDRYGDPAVRVARQRYARGEITREQYEQIMTDLERRRSLP